MSADPQASQSNLDNPVEIVISRTFFASRELVWQAWTNPNHVGKWWGPAGFTTTTHSMDFRAGGAWRYTMHGPDGHDYANRIEYIEIIEPSKLVYQHGGEGATESIRFRAEVTFEQLGDKQTRVTLRSIFPTPEARDYVINNFGAVEGGKQHLANLEDYLVSMVAGNDAAPPFSISQIFKAPREKVWQVWTEREHLVRWFGPQGSTMLHATIDLQVGGKFHYCMTHPNGMEMWGRWVFQAISRPDRLEFISSFSNAAGEITPAPFQGLEEFPQEIHSTVTLVDHAGISKGTLVTLEARAFNCTTAQRDFFTAFHGSMRQGWTGTLQQLAQYLDAEFS